MANYPWIDKYHPKSLDEVSLSIDTRKLIATLPIQNPINIVFAGTSGTGKTSTAVLLANKILKGNDKNLMIINPYENLGFKAISERLMKFAERASSFPHKVVIFEIAEAYQKKTQEQISTIITHFSRRIFFFFTCLETANLIDNINSKCVPIYFNPKPDSEIKDWCKKILEKEQKIYTEEGLNVIAYSAQGDLRKAINSLQICVNYGGEVTEKKAVKICDLPNPKKIKAILEICKTNVLRSIDKIGDLISDGYSVADIVKAFVLVISTVPMSEMRRHMLLEVATIAQLSISKEPVTNIQLHNMMFQLHKKQNCPEIGLFD
jgi:replication factor C subunit 2/4